LAIWLESPSFTTTITTVCLTAERLYKTFCSKYMLTRVLIAAEGPEEEGEDAAADGASGSGSGGSESESESESESNSGMAAAGAEQQGDAAAEGGQLAPLAGAAKEDVAAYLEARDEALAAVASDLGGLLRWAM
jgi:hypothetical protein